MGLISSEPMQTIYTRKPCSRCGSTENVVMLAGGPYQRLCEKCLKELDPKTEDKEE